MAAIDVSLDDYIRKNNIKHGPTGVTNKFGNRSNQTGQNRFAPWGASGFQWGQQQQQQQRRFQGGQKPGFGRERQGQGFITGRKPGFAASGPNSAGLVSTSKQQQQQQQQQGFVKKFSAKPGFPPQQRGAMGGGGAMGDARDKLVSKTKRSLMDARQKIITSQVKRGMFDARSKLSRKPARPPPLAGRQQQQPVSGPLSGSGQLRVPLQGPGMLSPAPLHPFAPPSQLPLAMQNPPSMGAPLQLTRKISNSSAGAVSSVLPGPMNISRTLTNTAVPGPRASQVQLGQGGNIKVTRTVPDTTVSFDGDSLTVTKRASAIQGAGPAKLTVQKTLAHPVRGPVIQIQNDKYAQPPPLHQRSYSSLGGRFDSAPSPSARLGPSSSSALGHASRSASSTLPPRPKTSAVTSRMQTGVTSRMEMGATSRMQTGVTSRMQTGVTSRMQTGATSRMQTGVSSRMQTGVTSRMQTGVTSRMQTGMSSRMQPTGMTSRMPPPPSPTTPAPASTSLKRKHPDSCGPLRFAKSTGESIKPSPPKKVKAAPPLRMATDRMAMSADMFADVEEEEDRDDDVLSPLQGYRVLVSNLHSVVNQDDIIELFGAIGALKKARLIKQGTAEVVYVNREDAVKAVHKYHNRELDGQPMLVKMMTPLTATIKQAEDESAPSSLPEPLRLAKPAQGKSNVPYSVEIPVIHKALFKIGSNEPSKPVTFTVKI